MERRRLGATGPQLSVLGLGCGLRAGLFVDGDAAAQLAVLREAVSLGVTYCDTAPYYGSGASEHHLGDALAGLAAPLAVSTKVSFGVDDLGDLRSSARRSVQTSCERLGRQRLDLVLLHNRVAQQRDTGRIVGPGPVLGLDDVLGEQGLTTTLLELRQDGLVGAIGFTTASMDNAVVDVLLNCGAFDYVNAEHSLVTAAARWSDDARSVPRRAAAAGLGVLAFRVLGGGQLVAGEATDARAQRLREWCLRHESSVARGAIRFALSDPDVTSLIIGLANRAEMHEAVAAAEAGPFDVAALAELAEISVRTSAARGAPRG